MGTPVSILPSSIPSPPTHEDCLCLPHPGLSHCSGGVRARFRKLEKEEQRLGCSMDDIKKCEGEIVKAVKDCIHWINIQEIMTCINDILGMTDCQKCICDVVPFIC